MYKETSLNEITHLGDIFLATGASKIIMLYAEGTSFSPSTASVNLGTTGHDNIGVYLSAGVDSGNTYISKYITTGTISGIGNNNYGVYAVEGSQGTYAGGSMTGAGVVSGISNGAGTVVTTTEDITISGTKSIGMYSELGGKIVLSSGKTISNTSTILETGIGLVTNGGIIDNNGNIDSQYIGIYGADKQDSGLVNYESVINQNTGIINATRDGDSSLPTIEEKSGVIGIYAKDNTTVNLNGIYTFNGKNKSVAMYLDENAKLISGVNGEIDLSYTPVGAVDDDKWTVGVYYDNGSMLKNHTAKINSLSSNVILLYSKDGGLTNDADLTISGANGTGIYGNNSAIKNTKDIRLLQKGIGVRLLSGTFDNTTTGRILLDEEESIGIYAGKDSVLPLYSTVTNIGRIEGTGTNNGQKAIGVYINGGEVAAQTYEFGISGGIATYLKDAMNYTGSETIKITGDSASSTKRTVGLYVDKEMSNPTIGTNIDVISKEGIGIYLASDLVNAAKLTHTGNINMSSVNDDDKYSVGVYLSKGVSSANQTTFTTTGNLVLGGKNNIGVYVDENTSFTATGNAEINSDDAILAYIRGNYTVGGITTTGTGGVNVVVDGGLLTNGVGNTLKVGTSGLQVIGQLAGGTAINQGTLVSTADLAVGLSGIYDTGAPTLTNDTTGVIDLTVNKSVGMYAEDGIINANNVITVGNAGVGIYAERGSHSSVLNVNSLSLTAGDEYIDTDSSVNKSVGIYAKDTDITYTGVQDIKVGNASFDLLNPLNDKYSIGVYAKSGASLTHIGKMTVGDGGIGYYAEGASTVVATPAAGSIINGTLFLSKNGASLTGDVANLLTAGELAITGDHAIALMADNASLDISATNIDKLKMNDYSVGIYVINNGVLTGTVSNIEVGKESTAIYDTTNSTYATNIVLNGEHSTGVRIDGGSTNFTGNIIGVSKNNIGVYAKKGIPTGSITTSSAKEITLTGETSTGIAAIGDTVIDNNSKITVGDNNSIGIYAKDISTSGTTIKSTNDIKVGEKGAGIYVTGTTGDINNTGNITTGVQSYGIYGKGINEINNNGDIIIAEKGTGLASINVSFVKNSGTVSTANVDTTLIFVKRDAAGTTNVENTGVLDMSNVVGQAVGIYSLSENGAIIESRNKNTIKVGESDFENDKYSIGMYTNGVGSKSTNESSGTIEVTKTYGIGMYGINGAEVINEGTINVSGEHAYGMYMEGAGTKGINTGTINVTGEKAIGIALFKGASLYNSGVVNLIGTGSVGIYADDESKNNIVNPSGTPIKNSSDNITEVINAGVINITGEKVTLNGVELTNHKVINIDGSLDVVGENSFILNTAGKGSINTGSISGEGSIGLTPDGTYGGTSLSYLVQTLNTSLLGSFEIYSLSPSFLAKILPSATGGYNFYLIKIPYVEMLKNTQAQEFGKGLDQIYLGARGREIDMFDNLSSITDKTELAQKFDSELRGNVYSNIQQRMTDVDEVFNDSYAQLRREENTTKSVSKVKAIFTRGDITDNNPAVEEYDYQSLGIMYVKEKENVIYGDNLNWSLGLMQSKFKIDQGSKEDVTSAKLGIGYERYLNRDSRFKISTTGELGINYHDMDRNIHLEDNFNNTGRYFSGLGQIKNKLNYEIPMTSKNIGINLYGSLNMGYGGYQKFEEKGDGIYLEMKSEDYFTVRPKVGAEVNLSHVTMKGHKLSLETGLSFEYEIMDIYGDGNQTKVARTDAGYYRLEAPEKIKDITKAGVRVGFETVTGLRVGAGFEQSLGSVEKTKYQIDFSWAF